METVRAEALRLFVEQLFRASGLSEPDAQLCAEMIELQEMRGVRTHGLRRVGPNLDGLSSGQMNTRPNRRVLHEEGATVVLDGDHGVGMIGCMDAMNRAIQKAKQFGIGIGVVANNNHFLSAAPYCLRAIEAEMIGITLSNTYGSMGYPGTTARAIANSPTGFGIPTSAEFPIVFDAALTTSGGKLSQWLREGKKIPPALLGLDARGSPTADPKSVLDGGTPMPIGDYKGAGLAILVEVLTGVLGGGGFLHGVIPPERRSSKQNAESQCCIAIDVAHFMPPKTFRYRMSAFIADLKSNPLAPGYDEILLPGEKAHRTLQACLRAGVPLEADVEVEVRQWANRLGVAFIG
jgi:LDH2 family malate/lactate/ureidoglycolate dehydrogenase